MLGYSPQQLKERLQNHPNWFKIKDKRWSIDHIFPIKAFVKAGVVDPKIINCLDNLQPMLLSENCKKNDKYNKSKFERWLKTKWQLTLTHL